jgi:hypothetical protein
MYTQPFLEKLQMCIIIYRNLIVIWDVILCILVDI